MATYVNDLRLKEITTGDESGTWGTSTNTNLSLIGEAVSYATQESFSSDADATTTVADGAADPARAFYFKVTSSGSLTATRTLTMAPNTVSRIQIIENATSGSQIITISQGSGASVNIPNGETRMIYMDGAGAGAAVVDALADINIGGKVTVGVDDTGYDVTLFGATSGQKVFWDESADTLYQTCTVDIDGSVTVGENDTGYDVKLFGATSGAYMLWDESADDLVLAGVAGLDIAGDIDVDGTSNLDVVDIDGAVDMASTLTLAGNADFNGDLDVDGTTNLDAVDIDGAVQLDNTFTVGENDTGYDVKFFGATSGAYMLWDESADDLKLVGAAGLTVAGDADIDGTLETDNLTIGSAQGSDGQVLTSTGSGVGWEDASGASDIDGLSDCLVENNSIWLGNDPSGTTDTASDCVALGTNALDAITTGDGNTAIGYDAGTAITGGYNNTLVGENAGKSLVNSYNNTFIGRYAGDANVNAYSCTAVGYYAGSTDHGSGCTFVGEAAGKNVTGSGSYQNTAVGQAALAGSCDDFANTAIGHYALVASTGARYSTALGKSAGLAQTTGDYNTHIGALAGDNVVDGTNNTSVGYQAEPSASDADNEVTLGNSSVDTLRCNTQTISALSDARDKQNIEELPLGVEFINTLRPVKFDWDRRDGSQRGVQEVGFLAQELDKAQQEADAEEYMRLVLKSNPDRLESTYGKLVPILTKAVQELSAEIEELKKKAHTKCEG